MSGIDWVWCPTEVTFRESFSVHDPEFGKKPHEYMSPLWVMDFVLPEQDLDKRRDIERAVSKSAGLIPFNVYDPRTPYPNYYIGVAGKNAPTSLIPPLYVKAVSKAGTITVSGADGDFITHGDPIAFTHEGWRYYFKAQDDLWLDGTDQVLPVFIRPRKNLTGLNILTDRIKPTCRFNVFINDVVGPTKGRYSEFSLRGVEHWGVL